MAVVHRPPVARGEEREGGMMGRLKTCLRAVRRAEARLANSFAGDVIGGVCVAVMTIMMVVSAGVLQ